MEVKMDEATYAFLKKKGGKLSISLMVPTGTCAGSMVPNMIFNSPKDPSKFRELTYQDITLYVSNVMDFEDNVVEIRLAKKMMLNDLELPTLKLM
ncbi:MAG: CC/Se motif family (seleno)protein [Bacillota bacterium]|nr:CC/Se motif family (seleno)protein [Bacillota bacterium]MDW7677460.1 CC/Se motif family (seleno)protein [Bacillota bacterium]